MAMTNTSTGTLIVPQLLKRGNYKSWSIFMEDYLISQELWDGIIVPFSADQQLPSESDEWRKRNAAALNAIKISCGPESFVRIKYTRLAKDALHMLAEMHKTEPETDESTPKASNSPLRVATRIVPGLLERGNLIKNSEHEEEEEDKETPKINSASMIVPELLASDNYKRWSICMTSYLVFQDLWDAVLYDRAPAGVDTKEWIKKGAAALHAIQISCTPKKFDEIEEITSAKIAWNTLKDKHMEDGAPSDFLTRLEERGFQTMERAQSLVMQNVIDEGDDVGAVMDIFKRNPGAENLGFWTGYPILHYATIVGKLNIVKALFERTPAVQKDPWGRTALTTAAKVGNIEIAKYLVSKDSSLLSVVDEYQDIPVVTACSQGHKDVTNFLYSETPFEILLRENGKLGSKLLLCCSRSERFDIMFDVLHHGQSLIDENWTDLLDGFARTPTAFSSGSGLPFWQRWIYKCLKVHIPSNFAVVTINQKGKKFEEIPLPGQLWRLASFLLPFLGIKKMHDLKLSHGFTRESLRLICQHLTKLNLTKLEDQTALRKALRSAIENGIDEFLSQMVKTNPDLLLAPVPAQDETASANFLMDAIAFRQEKIARFIIGFPVGKVLVNLEDSHGNNLLHIAGQLASNAQLSHISGGALRMQREIQWFREVERLVSQHTKEAKNSNDETAYQVLAREHKALLKEAEDWMKGLASSYIIVGTLIITIMFAAAFTLPGGNDEYKGFPIFKNKATSLVYIISDVISLFAAAASVIIFLGFLTLRYSMEGFHKSIPKRLMAGLFTLFVSLAAMMIAFCSAIFLMLENQWWIIIPSVLLAGIPVSLFAWLQFPLLVEIYVSTYRSPTLGEKRSLASKIKAFFFGKKKIEKV
ncbi:hypothetical protein SLEP1_g23860 [Rubroshorea leprosula]|uniref:PGG domain-containing protein n=1 Tax=Rubroshorea leprosula TaxID=152421 RepID=A0AAV5JP41_9ROSI|nr:hypothetical protein SLEP1_g23860 [Rubroshorea leprosula]